jgi:alkyl hydroperoxide reductase subunit AhpC
MIVQPGQPAPQVDVEAYIRGDDGPRAMSLGGRSETWTVLFFYPRDFTFVCPTELRGFAALGDHFAAEEAELIAASTDSWHVHKAWFEQGSALASIWYPVVADTAHTLSRAYGVLCEDGSALRGTFVIDPAGLVRHASVTDQSVGRSPEETLRVLQALRTGQLCPVSWRPGQPTLEIAA